MKINSYLIFLFFLALAGIFGHKVAGQTFEPLLSTKIHKQNKEKVTEELGKRVKVIRFLTADNPRLAQELEMWGKFLEGLDREFVGLVFIADQKSTEFDVLWNQVMRSDIALILDVESILRKQNNIGDDYTAQTLLLGEGLRIIEATGSPIVLDNFDLMRSVLGHELKRQGYKSGVKGPITDPSEGNPTWLMREPVYVDEEGKPIEEIEFIKLLESGKYNPKYTLSDTIRMIRRK